MLENKSQYLGSLVLIILSCLLFTMFNLLADNLENIITSFESNYSQEDAEFMTDQTIGNLSELENKYNAKMEEGYTVDYSVNENNTLRIFSANTKVNLPAIIKGSNISQDGILIDPAYAKANNLKIGDSINIYDKSFTINGFMSLPNYIYPLKSESDILTDSKHFGIAVLSKENMSGMDGVNNFYSIRFNGDKKDINSKVAEFKNSLIDEKVNIISWMNTSTNPRITFVTAKQDGIKQISSSMPIMILILTCILTGIVMWRMVKHEAAIIGTLYALGYRKKEILNHYIKYPFIIALAGGILGTIFGAILLTPMLKFMVTYFNMPIDTVRFNAEYEAISILLPIFFLCISGFFVVNKALKSSPLELIRGGKESSKVGFLERFLKLEHFKFTTKFKIREQLRSIARSAFLLLGVILATMLLLMGFASKSSLDKLSNTEFDKAFQYNYSYVYRQLQQGNTTIGEAFSELPFTLSTDENVGVTVYGVSTKSQFITFKDTSGQSLSTDQVIVTKGLADKLKLKPNDTIEVTSKLNSKTYSITIDSIADSYVGNYIYMPQEKFNQLFDYPAGSYMGIWSTDKLNIQESDLLTTVTKDDIKNAFASMTQPIQSVVGVMAFLAFLIGLIVIYVVTSLVIEENKENISLMKILGYRKREVYSMILNSSVYSVILGYILGVPLLLVSLGAMMNSITKDMGLSLPITISYIYLVVGFAVIYVTYEASKALSKKKVNRISMNEVLKSRME